MTDKPAPVEQADRDAAADVVYSQMRGGMSWMHAKSYRAQIQDGRMDSHPTVQAFARHRQPLAPRIAELEAALTWYADRAANCRKMTQEGDNARADLDRDGGDYARRALLGDTK